MDKENDNSSMTKEELEAAREFYFGPADYGQSEQDKYEAPRRSQTPKKKTNTGMK
mgnify:CR=1 FL=1|jgi:hypothetical protein